jgi:Holliday junction resolvase-like predicted endonuclease
MFEFLKKSNPDHKNKKIKTSSIQKNNFSKARGEHAEKRVCEHFLKKDFQLVAQRKKLFGVEFDLIFKNKNHLAYVEVKSVHSADFFLMRWPKRQKQRFTKVASVLAERQNSKFYLAMVDYNDKVHLFNVGSEV